MGGSNPMAGRPRKPTAMHILEGSFTTDRHGDRIDEAYEDKLPKAPHGLGRDGKWLWDLVLRTTPAGVLKEIDSAELFGLCKWWAVWRKLDRSLAQKLTPKTLTMAGQAWAKFAAAASHYGLSPAARARLQTEHGMAAKDDRNSQLAKKYLG